MNRLWNSALVVLALAVPTLVGGGLAFAEDKPKTASAAAKNPVVVFDTSAGNIKIEVFADKSPITAANFLKYVDEKFYDGLIFHRVVPGFVIQGGGYDVDMKERPNRPAIKNEASNGVKNEAGTLSMARTPDPDSATSQFFVSLVDNKMLDYSGPGPQKAGYAVFGKVVEGMDVVKKIGATKTTVKKGMPDVPETAIVIKSAARAK